MAPQQSSSHSGHRRAPRSDMALREGHWSGILFHGISLRDIGPPMSPHPRAAAGADCNFPFMSPGREESTHRSVDQGPEEHLCSLRVPRHPGTR
ncbi:hypothetical protein NDU88_005426 [Pleurodeles waltl]|uniref:Uncharacterized protein n=1 Tax=Pleurodeles waltl TaxID=8319 RepID=A0AAV7SLR7_PLEWA|nr:hypothetical protein NDU88_005426 [Pleurodeles waltl]